MGDSASQRQHGDDQEPYETIWALGALRFTDDPEFGLDGLRRHD